MALNINDNQNVLASKPSDARYYNNLVPYISVAEANASIGIITQRYTGLTVNVLSVEYWYKDGIEDVDLIPKESPNSSSGITNASNGLTKVGQYVVLGGALTGNTSILGATNTIEFGTSGSILNDFDVNATTLSILTTGVVDICPTGNLTLDGSALSVKTLGTYDVDYSGSYTLRSIPDVDFVTGLTSQAIISASNGLTKSGTNIVLGGALTSDTTINGAHTLNFTPSVVNINSSGELTLSGSSINVNSLAAYDEDYSGSYVARSIPDVDFVTGLTGQAILTASNGLTKTGTNVVLGGALIQSTSVEGGSYPLTFNSADSIQIDGQTNGTITVKSQSGTIDNPLSFVNSVGILVDFNDTNGFAVHDNRAGVDQTGIIYAANYQANFVNRSLVDKEYVDTIATGLNFKSSVDVVTTVSDGNINLASFTGTIDSLTVLDTWRVLIKNQTDASQNGIYVYSGGSTSFIRSSDYDGTPEGEVANGDIIPVISGSTLLNTMWALVTADPITLGTTDLVFNLFSQLLGVSEGDGIDISVVNGKQEISVELKATTPGLEFIGTGLNVDRTIFTSGLTTSGGDVLVNASTSSIVGAELPVLFGAANDLVIDTNDLPLVGASNGLTKTSTDIILGGVLTGNTVITTDSGLFTVEKLDSTSGIVVDNTGYVSVFSNNVNLNMSADGLSFTDSRTAGSHKGIVYSADYSDDFVDRSLIDYAYMNNFVTGLTGQAIITANNGLTKVGTNVVLGGTLTGNTTIGFDGNSLNFSGGTFNIDNTPFIATNDNVLIGKDAGSGGTNVVFSNFIGSCAGFGGTDSEYSNFIGSCAGYGATAADSSNFIGSNAGYGATDAYYANFMGSHAGWGATDAYNGNFIGENAGYNAINAVSSNFIGTNSGYDATNASNSNFIGENAGCGATSACHGNFIGCDAGKGAINSEYSNFIGKQAGLNAKDSSHSTFIGFNVGAALFPSLSVGDNNVIIGNNVTLPPATTDSLNIGNIIYGKYLYGSGVTTQSSSPVNGFIGINVLDPTVALEISGDTKLLSLVDSASDSVLVEDSGVLKKRTVASIIGSSSITGATNGLTKVGQVVVLGGALTGDTTISGSHTLALSSLTAFNATATNIALTGIVGITGALTTTTTATIGGALTLSSVAAGAATNDVLVIDGGVVKKIDPSVLGEDNNSLIISGISSATTLDASYYVVLGDSTGGGFIITLPASPATGQSYIIKDSGGDALSNNITVSGNGKTIDGGANATINTDYGAFEIVYDGTQWLTLSFVN